MSTSSPPWPKFCRHCGVGLPPGQPRFCIECGGDVAPRDAPAPPAPPPARREPARAARTQRQKGKPAPTVRLGNAGVEQSVIGGTVQLPTSGATPPGLWVLDEPPGPDAVLAIYAPLRAVVGGWSGLVGKGWQADGSQDQPDGRAIFRFSAAIEWFPAPGCGAGLRLRARIGADSRGKEGRERRGFRYLAHHDAPMRLLEAAWVGPDGAPRDDIPLPQIQIMAPPRVPRVSDYDEQVATMPAAEAERWAAGSQAPGVYHLNGVTTPTQAQTPVGRGIVLTPVGLFERRLRGILPQGVIDFGAGDRFRVQLMRPYTCDMAAWVRQLRKIRAEARELGMAMEAEPAAEWWLDRNGYDGVILTKAQARYGAAQAAIAFRRSQIVRVSHE
ncbi:zinc ribbon domain-containing protein [Oscillochloris sp. ZM17-4]|uniref:zinc ribbon domain-containing protein n=1 Tax=Oscillochloris sp. ZM17-4 TaxID=2866714 RepID=UPI001C7361CC|nr:zinc ribbon domain-containing protein [Oscillochloris sp. ZM17-4]MBX0328054.1 zinc ribbon domain-containing protein [Oscillochloris sp. ZM17-4]